MSLRSKILLIAIALLAAFGAGRWSAPEKVKTEKQVVVKHDSTSTASNDKSKDTETHIIEHPDGTKETIITTHENWEKNHSSSTTNDTSSSSSKEVTARKSMVTVSALGGVDLSGDLSPVYGVSLTKPVLGPVTVGAWGLSNKTFGLSVGLTF